MLYPVELQAHVESITPAGRGRGIRTPDIQLPKLALYQTELYPVATCGTLPRTEALECYGRRFTSSIRIQRTGGPFRPRQRDAYAGGQVMVRTSCLAM